MTDHYPIVLASSDEPKPMSVEEAKSCVDDINHHLKQADESLSSCRVRVLEFYERQGYLALGYPSMKECAESGMFFGSKGQPISWQYVYQIKDAADTYRNMRSAMDEPDDLPDEMPERHLRKLRILHDPNVQAAAYAQAQALASSEGAEKVQMRHIDTAVDEQIARGKVNGSDYKIVAHLMNTGSITPSTAQAMIGNLDSVPKSTVVRVLDVIGKYGGLSPELIVPFGTMFDRGDRGDKSKTLETILATGHIGKASIAKATLSDLRHAQAESNAQVRSELENEANQESGVKAVIVTIYVGDVERTARVLKRELGRVEYSNLGTYINNQSKG